MIRSHDKTQMRRQETILASEIRGIVCVYFTSCKRIRVVVVRYSSRRISSKCFFLKLLKIVCKSRSTKSCHCALDQRGSLYTALLRKFINIYFAVAQFNLNVRNCSVSTDEDQLCLPKQCGK